MTTRHSLHSLTSAGSTALVVASVLCIMMVFCGDVSAESINRDAVSIWRRGYLEMHEAADQLKKKKDREAFLQYQTALKYFEEVRKKYPNFEPEMVNFRLEETKAAITELQVKHPNDLYFRTQRQIQNQVSDIKKKNTELEKKYSDLEKKQAELEKLQHKELEKSQSQLAKKNTELEKKQAEFDKQKADFQLIQVQVAEFQKKNKELEKKNKELEKKQAEFDKQKTELQQIQVQVAEFQKKNKELEKKNKDLEKKNSSLTKNQEKVSDIQKKHSDLEKKYSVLEKKNTELAKKNTSLEKQYQQASVELNGASDTAIVNRMLTAANEFNKLLKDDHIEPKTLDDANARYKLYVNEVKRIRDILYPKNYVIGGTVNGIWMLDAKTGEPIFIKPEDIRKSGLPSVLLN